MRINKILNNNSVITMKNEEEIIVIGRGVAFNRRIGDEIDQERIEKIFFLENEENRNRLKSLVTDIPIDYMEVAESIISYAKIKLGKKLNESIYIHLIDHIYFAVERFKNDMPIKNGLLWETKQLYKEEYDIGLEALNMICERFGVVLPEDEAGFLALHIVNAGLNEEMPVIRKMTKIMQDILSIIRYHAKVEFDESSLTYYRFITHLKFFAQRLVKGTYYDEAGDEELLNIIKKKYASAYDCTMKIKKFIENQYNYHLTDEETMYLTIHIERVLKNKI